MARSLLSPLILLENGDHSHVSRGDGAMLKASIDLLRGFWPGASLGVVSSSPTRLGLIDPSVASLPERHPERWTVASAPKRHLRLPDSALDLWWAATERWAVPYRARRLAERFAAKYGASDLLPWARPPRLDGAPLRPDLALAVGGGYLCDMDADRAIAVLNTLEWAAATGSVTALASQGVGPVTHEGLRRRMSEVLPHVDLILLREQLTGPPILQEVGVDPAKVAVVGDDALFLSARAPADLEQRSRLGVCLRAASYLEFETEDHDWLVKAIAEAARRLGVPVRPVTACEWRDEDRRPNAALRSRVPAFEPDLRRSAAPQDFADAFRACRAVVATTYHAAVFSLSQGVPVVAIYRSHYQFTKFAGLAQLFGGEGMTLVDSRDRDARRNMTAIILAAWEAASGVGASLCGKAERIRTDLRGAYERLAALVERKSQQAEA